MYQPLRMTNILSVDGGKTIENCSRQFPPLPLVFNENNNNDDDKDKNNSFSTVQTTADDFPLREEGEKRNTEKQIEVSKFSNVIRDEQKRTEEEDKYLQMIQ